MENEIFECTTKLNKCFIEELNPKFNYYYNLYSTLRGPMDSIVYDLHNCLLEKDK